jgi:hypothetical protein
MDEMDEAYMSIYQETCIGNLGCRIAELDKLIHYLRSRWRKILKSRFLQGLEAQSHIYFNVLLGVLVLLLLGEWLGRSVSLAKSCS